MECQECHQRQATVHLTQVINGQKTEIHVCEHCAKDKGYMSYGEENFTLNDLLSGLFHSEGPSPYNKKAQPYQQHNQLKCPTCGLTYQEFARIGKFGCATCYKTFDERLNPIFRRVHSGNTRHDGKIPKREGGNLHLKREIDEHKSKLRQLIEQEEFEQAAKVRDRIKNLEQQLHQGEDGEQ
ncbi:UvrB/UvrC motif-containing protein [Halobacillus yeomjeoni]|uniref:UvrB/UvrC motif-containing protein n=1 Tax=Halobacillus yeomjeoni TaxID=311194 RepID=A0A931HXM6_9BACI|nr:UvrB/UvrC motif-containing protein [Halobacillus yeomjeoni]MBH0231742.1 UvrB/UvrC motif-containing protein [Halobacillus yeomjeoni]MCA0985537.1 UvrB/UvrC motif-containing protein [Halobacillus yeomjeoni]